MPRYKCTAEEIIYHEWEVEAADILEAHEFAGEGCPNDCETKGAHFGDIKIFKVKEAKTMKKEIKPCICGSFEHQYHPTVTPENQKPHHTPTPNEMKARSIVIGTLIPSINKDLAKLQLADGHETYSFRFLSDHRFSLAQERNRLNEAIAKAEAKS